MPLLKLFLKTTWSPLQITLLSIFLGFIGALLFLFGDYYYLVAGVFFLNLSLILDKVDGQVARLKKQTSKFGGWLDSLGDVLLIEFYFAFLAIGTYLNDHDPNILIFALACSVHFLLAIQVMHTKVIFGFKDLKEVKYGNNYVGLISSLHVYLSIGCLLDQVHYALLLFSLLGFFIWIPSSVRVYKKFKDL